MLKKYIIIKVFVINIKYDIIYVVVIKCKIKVFDFEEGFIEYIKIGGETYD